MTNNEMKAIDFLKQQLWKHDEIVEDSKIYRYEHSMRVAAIGRKIAKAEGLNEEALVLGCILHDVGTFDSLENPDDHGRVSAKISRRFLQTFNLSQEIIEEICYGIAMHADGNAGYEGEKTALNISIADSDDIDRFDAYRIFDLLRFMKFHEMTLDDQLTYVDKFLAKLNRYRNVKFATKTGTDMWVNKVCFQIEYFERLKAQLEAGKQFKSEAIDK